MTKSEMMSRVKSKDTKIEVLLRKELWRKGYRYRKNVRAVFGTPDIVFKGKKIAIFCDSEFWHGKDYMNGKTPSSNVDFWIEKFKRNIKRDELVNKTLHEQGWLVLRFWEKDIKKRLDLVIVEIEKYLHCRILKI